jgi:hypothetical protein
MNIVIKIFVFCVLWALITSAFAKKLEVNISDVQETSFYTGCIDGWIVAYEQGWYKKPEHMTAQEVFQALKAECNIKSQIYRKEQEAMR